MKAIVVGSGAGGGSVAKELAKAGISVTIIEKGPFTSTKKAYKHYNILNVGTEVSSTVCLGGTTLVTAGNAVRTCEESFKKLGILFISVSLSFQKYSKISTASAPKSEQTFINSSTDILPALA
jgi:folate-dependent tRNA-U54 methylase TrmFO/GidA